MIFDLVKNIFNASQELPNWYVRKPQLDAQIIEDCYGKPEYVSARNGKRYLYFDYMDGMDFSMMRQMGLKPHLHYSRYHFPPCVVCRIPVDCRRMSDNATAVVDELKARARNRHVEFTGSMEEYNKYKSKYKSAFFTKTK